MDFETAENWRLLDRPEFTGAFMAYLDERIKSVEDTIIEHCPPDELSSMRARRSELKALKKEALQKIKLAHNILRHT